jgi:hypothetical protein
MSKPKPAQNTRKYEQRRIEVTNLEAQGMHDAVTRLIQQKANTEQGFRHLTAQEYQDLTRTSQSLTRVVEAYATSREVLTRARTRTNEDGTQIRNTVLTTTRTRHPDGREEVVESPKDNGPVFDNEQETMDQLTELAAQVTEITVFPISYASAFATGIEPILLMPLLDTVLDASQDEEPEEEPVASTGLGGWSIRKAEDGMDLVFAFRGEEMMRIRADGSGLGVKSYPAATPMAAEPAEAAPEGYTHSMVDLDPPPTPMPGEGQ